MANYIVAIAFDKVQTFIYDVIHAHIQEKQANDSTLKTIIYSSKLISEDFHVKIGLEGNNGKFANHIDEELLKCSGMCVFSTSLDKNVIEERLNELFNEYYIEFNGQLMIKYTYFSSSNDKLADLKKAKACLKRYDCLNKIIKANKDTIFNFHSISSLSHDKCINKDYPMFAENINKLFNKGDADNDNHFRIAVIKADLDGMGVLFNNIQDFETYSIVSKTLYRCISLDELAKQTTAFQKRDETLLLYPIYVAGDDIFFAVPMSKLVAGVNICKAMLDKVNEELRKKPATQQQSLPPLTMSIGIDFTFNREPIRYYYERVQYQLDDHAKKAVAENVYIKLCINNYVFHIYETPKKDNNTQDDQPNWYQFLHSVKLLKNYVASIKANDPSVAKNYEAHHFFYGLLNKITDPTICSDEVKYSNAVLYHLLPKYLESPNKELRESELFLLEMLIKQILVKIEGKKEFKLCFKKDHRQRLELYVRLLVLFSDPRFKLTEQVQQKEIIKFDGQVIKRIRAAVFNKTLRYLYKQNLAKSEELREIFVKEADYTPSCSLKKGNNKKKVYRTLQISTSLFYKMKNMDKINIEKAAAMIYACNDRSEEAIATLEKERKKEQKPPPGLAFNPTRFYGAASLSGKWTTDYIDSLLIFYRYKEQAILYKNTYKSNGNSTSKGVQGNGKN